MGSTQAQYTNYNNYWFAKKTYRFRTVRFVKNNELGFRQWSIEVAVLDGHKGL